MHSINLSAESLILISKKGRWWNKETVDGLHVSRVRVLLGTQPHEACFSCLCPQSKPRKTRLMKILILNRKKFSVKFSRQGSSNLPLSLCFLFQVLVNVDRTDLESPNTYCWSPGGRFRHLAHCSCPYWTEIWSKIFVSIQELFWQDACESLSFLSLLFELLLQSVLSI